MSTPATFGRPSVSASLSVRPRSSPRIRSGTPCPLGLPMCRTRPSPRGGAHSRTIDTMSDDPVLLIVGGCCGRMGSLVVEEAAKEKNLSRFQVVGGVERAGHPQLGQHLPGVVGSARVTSNLEDIIRAGNLIIEFTLPEATLDHAKIAAEINVPMIIGTTGFTTQQFEQLQNLSRKIPIFWSPNMSIGIVVVRRAMTAISQLLFRFGLGEQAQANISEIHHTKKLDKPSGTAKALAQELLKSTGWLIKDEEIEAKREGDVIGVHAVTFRCPSENITLIHEATDRRVFAQGAVLIAKNFHRLWKKPGWYGMDNFVSAIETK